MNTGKQGADNMLQHKNVSFQVLSQVLTGIVLLTGLAMSPAELRAQAQSAKISVGLLPFDDATGAGIGGPAADALGRQLRGQLIQSGKLMPKILTLTPGTALPLEPEQASELGRTAKVDIVVAPTVMKAETKSSQKGASLGRSVFGVQIGGAKATGVSAEVQLQVEMIRSSDGQRLGVFRVDGKKSVTSVSADAGGLATTLGSTDVANPSFQSSPLGQALQDALLKLAAEIETRSGQAMGKPLSSEDSGHTESTAGKGQGGSAVVSSGASVSYGAQGDQAGTVAQRGAQSSLAQGAMNGSPSAGSNTDAPLSATALPPVTDQNGLGSQTSKQGNAPAGGSRNVPLSTTKVAASASGARFNVTGVWSGNFLGGSDFHLSQDGDRVWGKFSYGNGTGFARGNWNDGRLILVLVPTTAQVGGACDPRKILVIPAKGTATSLAPYVLDLGNVAAAYTGRMQRTSPSPGPAIDYPYEAELKNCGQLMTYDLVFDTNSDKLKSTDWPILQVLADLLKKDPALKIQIAGHTDSTGDAAANQALSERRANTVKQMLTERYGADANRLDAKGYGPEQPMASNDTEQGRAINRRVELVKE
jgi:outer membrane protein OmpA-like peptidoglycan-associated protein